MLLLSFLDLLFLAIFASFLLAVPSSASSVTDFFLLSCCTSLSSPAAADFSFTAEELRPEEVEARGGAVFLTAVAICEEAVFSSLLAFLGCSGASGERPLSFALTLPMPCARGLGGGRLGSEGSFVSMCAPVSSESRSYTRSEGGHKGK